MEGIAVALDTDYRSLRSPDLVSLGLLQGHALPSLDIRQEGLRWLDYYPAGSFVHFLLRRYGLEKFVELYKLVGTRYLALWRWVRRVTPGGEEFARRVDSYLQEIDTVAREIFGEDLKGLQTAWVRYLKDLSGMAVRATYALRALNSWETVWELRVQLGGFAQIGFLGPVPRRLRETRGQMLAKLHLLLADPSPQSQIIAREFADFQAALQAYRPLLESWWAAASRFTDVEEQFYHGITDCGPLIDELHEIHRLYERAGDTVMAAKISRYIKALELFAAGRRLINGIMCERGLRLLRQAQALFRQLAEPTLVAQVRSLIVTRASCYQPT